MTDPRGQLYYLPNARKPEQKSEMAAMEPLGICIFCPEGLTYETGDDRPVLVEHELGVCLAKEVLLENNTWVVLRNEYQYDNVLVRGDQHQHFMLVPRRHVRRKDELSPGEMVDYLDILRQAVDELDLPYYSDWSRNGDPLLTGATIYHLHMQLAMGDPEAAKNGDRLIVFLS